MYSRCWLVIRDDGKRTFEVCGQETNTNYFTNTTHAMQKAGMNVSCLTPALNNRNSSKELVKVANYTREEGLYKRLMDQFRDITMKGVEDWGNEE